MSGRLNRKSTIKNIETKIEEQEQAEMGFDERGVPIAYYTVRALVDLAKDLELGEVRQTILTDYENSLKDKEQ